MGWLLLLIVGGSIVLSGVAAGLARAMHNVTGVSFPLLFGDPAQKHDLGVIPALLLKTGIFSVPAIWGTFLIGFGSRAEITLLLGVGSGALLALVNVLLIKLLIRFRRIGFELLGLMIGLVVGGILGVVAMNLIGLYASEIMDVGIFVFICIGIGAIVGGLNGITLSGMIRGTWFYPLSCEIVAGGIVMGSAGTPFFIYAFHSFGGVQDPFDLILFIIGPMIFGCLMGGCILLAEFAAVSPLRRGFEMLLNRSLKRLPARTTEPSLGTKLLILLILTGILGGGMLGIGKSLQHLLTVPFGEVTTFGRDGIDKILSIRSSKNGGYALVGGERIRGGFFPYPLYSAFIYQLDKHGHQMGEDSFQAPIQRIIQTTLHGGYLAYIEGWKSEGLHAEKNWSLLKFDDQGRKEWEYCLQRYDFSNVVSVVLTPDQGYVLGVDSRSYETPSKVLKLNPSGQEVWKNFFNVIISSLHLTKGGEYFLLGKEAVKHSVHYGVFRLNSERYLVWKHFCDSIQNATSLAGQVIPDGTYIMIGQQDTQDGWICKVSPAGEELWTQTFQNKEKQATYLFKITPAGEVLVGETWDQNFNLSKLNSEGNQVWKHTFNLDAAKSVSTIMVTADEAYVLLIGTDSRTGKQPWIMGCDQQGQQLWEYTFHPEQWLSLLLNQQTRQIWEQLFHFNDDLFRNWGRAEYRKVGYPPYYLLWTIALDKDTIEMTPDGGVMMGITVRVEKYNAVGKFEDTDTWLIKFMPQKMPRNIRQ